MKSPCSQMIGGTPEVVMVSADLIDFIIEVDKELNNMGHLYWL